MNVKILKHSFLSSQLFNSFGGRCTSTLPFDPLIPEDADHAHGSGIGRFDDFAAPDMFSALGDILV